MSTTSSKMMAYDTAKKSFDFVKCENGVLTVSSGGSGASDASSANQLTQITEAQTANSKLTTINSNILICKAELQASVIVQEAINEKLNARLVTCDTGNVVINSSTPVKTLLLAKVENTDNNAYLILDDAQNLKVSVSNQNDISTLSTSANQDLQIIEAELTNTKLETINTTLSGTLSVDVDNQLDISGLATSALQESSNTAIWNKLNLIEQGTEINSGYLQTIDFKLTPLQQGISRYTIDAKTTLAPDTVPSYSAPPSGIDASEGWYYKNLALGNASQLYYYANQASQTQNHDYTISAIQSQWAVVRILNLNSTTGLPFLVVYSQPQGAGDHIPGFARSSWVYQVASGQDLRLGEKVVIYRGSLPDTRIFPELRRVQCSLTVSNGPCLSTEILAYATLNSDSGASVGDAEYIVAGAGLSFAGDHVYKVELTGESSVISTGNATSENQINSNIAICSRLDTANTKLTDLTFDASSNILVYDGSSVAELVTIREILGDSVPTKLFAQLDSDPNTIIPILGNSGNLFVYDAQCNTVLSSVNDELLALNATYGALIDGTSSMYVRLDGTDDQVQIWGYNPDLAMPEAIYTKTNALKVNVDNPIIDYATETTSALIKAQTDKLSFYDDGFGAFDLRTSVVNEVAVSVNNTPTVSLSSGTEVAIASGAQIALTAGSQVQLVSSEVGLTAGSQVGLSAGASVEVSNFPTKQSVFVENTAEGFDINVNITNGSLAITSATALSVTETAPVTSVFAKLQDSSENGISSSASEANGNVLNTRLFGYDVANDLIRPVRQGENGGLFVENITSVDFEVVAKNDVKVINATGTSLDVHCFASSNGTDFHHVKSTATGELVVHSQVFNSSGTAITSTPNGGITALDVAVSGTATISGVVDSRAQEAFMPSVITSTNVTGPVQIGTVVDTQHYLWISAILQFSSVTAGGNIYLEVSPDSSMWARPSGAQVFINTSVTNTTGAILLSSPVSMRYVRLWADTGFIGVSGTAYVCCK